MFLWQRTSDCGKCVLTLAVVIEDQQRAQACNITQKKHKAKPVIKAFQASDRILMTSLRSLFGAWIDFQKVNDSPRLLKKKKKSMLYVDWKFVMRIRGFCFISGPKSKRTGFLWLGLIRCVPSFKVVKLFGIGTHTWIILEFSALRNSSKKFSLL